MSSLNLMPGFVGLWNQQTMTTENVTEELEESFESFERRELAGADYGSNPASANCDTNNTNCVKPW